MTSNEYITFAQRDRMKRLAIGALLMTEKGGAMTLRQIAQQFACDARTVASVKSDLNLLGLFAAFTHEVPVMPVPQPTYLVLAERIDQLVSWLRELDYDGVSDATLSQAGYEVEELRRIVLREGSMPRFMPEVTDRLDALETLMARPEYDLPTLPEVAA